MMIIPILKRLADLVSRLIMRIEVVNTLNLPPQQGALLAVNHIHGIDPVIISYVVYPNWLHHIAKEEIFRIPLLAAIVRGFGAIPMNRQRPGADSVKQALECFREGKYVCIFPQGTRRKDEFGEIKKGAARLALSGNVPIYPVAITGLEKVRFWGFFRRPRVRIIFGEPIAVEGRNTDKEEVDALTQELQATMKELYCKIRL